MPVKQPLLGGAYTARSLIANAQRCINLYPEANPEDAPFPYTHYLTPGLTSISSCPTPGLGRGLYRSTDGRLFAAVGSFLYHIDQNGSWSVLGSISDTQTMIQMVDNGIDLMVVDGSGFGWTVSLADLSFSELVEDGFYGSTFAQFVDTYFILNQPNTKNFYYSMSNSTQFNPLNIAAKTVYADPLVAAIVIHREIWLIGQLTTEVWYNTGASDFTFGIMPGVFIEHGCAAPYSIAKQDLMIFWVSQDLQGQAMVIMGTSYQAKRISTHAIEFAIQQYPTISDAVGFCYQHQGHTFYQLTFPTADATWVFDVSTGLWHQRGWVDSNGIIHRHRAIAAANCYGKVNVMDWQTGQLYYYDETSYTDNGTEIVRIRGFPHIKQNDVRVSYKYFVADFSCGQMPGILTPSAPTASLRWSDDGGFTWSNNIEQSLGGGGQYIKSVKWNRLGLARDRVFELSWSGNVNTALNGASLDPKAAAS